MNVKELIYKLLGIEVTTDDLHLLMKVPEACTKSQEDANKLIDLVKLIDLSKQIKEE